MIDPISLAVTPDTQHTAALSYLPKKLRGLALLARLDRPIGWWLLFWPCAWGVLLAGGAWTHGYLILWMLMGSIAMRGAGCVYNDIVDRDLDAQVERTRQRPLPAGLVSVKAAWVWLIALCLIGLVVLLQLRVEAQAVALASLALVAAYPFMKRITWWPQAWLGMVFSWGALVGWIAVQGVSWTPAMLWLYAGCVAWVIGYDTIYALQDREDDAMVGIRSSALRLGDKVRLGVGLFYGAAIICWAMALWSVRPNGLTLVALIPGAVHLMWQASTLDSHDPHNPLARFRSNRNAGFLVMMACLVVGNA
jgi:4-hydroxybenzoate polyprenyltransferase